MPNPPRRPFFQIHLSTAIVLMFTAGALVWANVTKQWVLVLSNAGWAFGWPFKFYLSQPSKGDIRWHLESIAGFLNIPMPITMDTTIMVRSKKVSLGFMDMVAVVYYCVHILHKYLYIINIAVLKC